MTNALKIGAALALLLASGAAAYADDPTGVLLQEQRAQHSMGWRHHHHGRYEGRAAFSDVGPCGPGTQSEAFPNGQGFRCVPR
jgi:hypothetical protein